MRIQQILETPIAATDDPNNPMIYGHEKANPMELKSRINITRNMLKELSEMAQSNDLATWERLTKMALGGGWTMGLVQNLQQVQHGIDELAKKRKKGGTQSRGIDKNIG